MYVSYGGKIGDQNILILCLRSRDQKLVQKKQLFDEQNYFSIHLFNSSDLLVLICVLDSFITSRYST